MSYIGSLNTHRGLIGKLGEDAACVYLESIGHLVIERNYRIRYGEVDIITIKDSVLHFVEVKTTQSSNTTPEEHIDAIKMRKMKKLAELYYNEYLKKIKSNRNEENSMGIYLDFIGVVLDSKKSVKELRYLEMLEV